MTLRLSESWLAANCHSKPGKLAKPRKKRESGGIPDISTRAVKSPAAKQLLALEYDLAPSPHAKQLLKLARDSKYAKRKGPEHKAQVTYFDYLWRKHRDIYDRLHATPNGGVRDDLTGFEMKAEGQKRGFPDVTLNVARGIYHGLHLELKVGANSMSDAQKYWQRLLREEGYACELVRGWEAMVEVTLRYWLLSTGESL